VDEKSEQNDKKYQAGILLSPLRCGVTQLPTIPDSYYVLFRVSIFLSQLMYRDFHYVKTQQTKMD